MNRIQLRWFGEFEDTGLLRFIFDENSIRNPLDIPLSRGELMKSKEDRFYRNY
jgi:hypothetical protein